MASTVSLRVGAKSDTGLVRSENQDRMTRFVSRFGEVFIVADGMGGHQGGATAAAMVVQGFEKHLSESAAPGYEEALQDATRRTNQEVYALGSSGRPEYAGMGSTVVLALFTGNGVVIGHVGDSRAYLIREGRLERLTTDHTAVQRMVSAGMLSEAEAREHPDASVLSRVIGQGRDVDLELLPPAPFGAGDAIMLCSDGLSGYVDDVQIAEALAHTRNDPPAVVEALIGLAMAAGGEDNVTVQYIRPQTGRTNLGIPIQPRKLVRSKAVWVGLAMAALASAAGLYWARLQVQPPPILKAPQKLVIVEPKPVATPPVPPPPNTHTPPPPGQTPATPPAGQTATPPSSQTTTPPPTPPRGDELTEFDPAAAALPRVILLSGNVMPPAETVDRIKGTLTADPWKSKIRLEPSKARRNQNYVFRDETRVLYNTDQDRSLAEAIANDIGVGTQGKFSDRLRSDFKSTRVLVVLGRRK